MKRTAFSNASGFSTIQLVITIAVMMIVTGFAVVSISRARDHVRLMNSARQFAAYVERARGDAVRRHNNATVAVVNNTTYSIEMDWDGFGTTRIQNFNLERGVVFTTDPKSITFNWRGRINSEESFGFAVNRGSAMWQRTVSVGVTGSGDVTFEAEYFYDNQLPAVTVTGQGGNVLPEPGATPGSGSPSPSPSPGASPTPTAGPSPTPTATPDQNPTPTPTPDPNATPTPDPNATPTPDQNPTPTPTQPCVLNAPDSLTITSDASATVSVNRTNAVGTGTITATSSNSGQIQVTPSSRTVSGTAAGSFTITVKKNSGSVTFSSSGCTSKTVDITVQ